MGVFKSIKNLIRRGLFNPFGYDLVPLKKNATRVVLPAAKASVSPDKQNLSRAYVEWFGEQAVRERRFYNVGAEAGFSHPAWTVVNHPSEHYGAGYMDLQWDMMSGEPMPIETGKAHVIFSRYTLEHVTDEAVVHFLAEAQRSLAKDGYLRLIVPDIDIYYRAYQEKDASLFYRPGQDGEKYPNEKFLANPNQASLEQRFLWTFASNASTLHPDGANQRISDGEFQEKFRSLEYETALNYCTSKISIEAQRRHPENHINWFNAVKLERLLRDVGFQTLYRSAYAQSRCAVLRDVSLLEARRPEIGLYMEAIR